MRTHDNKLALSYDRYYKKPSLVGAQHLLEEIRNFDFNNYWEFVDDMERVPIPVGSHANIEMHSGGTTTPKHYRFGPYPRFWISAIEKTVKNPSNKLSVLLLIMLSIGPSSVYPFPIDLMPHEYCVNGNWFGDTQTLLRGLDSLPSQNLLISSVPRVFLYLSRDREFLDHAEAMKWSMESTYSESFYPRKPFQERSIHVNDNMINWVNGHNFFECPYGTKHFLPIFLKKEGHTVNLLNLVGCERDDDDLWHIDPGVSRCACGKDYLKITFMPHRSAAIVKESGEFFYAPEFAELLEERYFCFQFIQQDKRIKVLYAGNMSAHDRMVTTKFLGMHGFDHCDFIENSFIFTAPNKTASFYRNSKNNPILDYPHMWGPLKLTL
jgi:hypothetical protein